MAKSMSLAAITHRIRRGTATEEDLEEKKRLEAEKKASQAQRLSTPTESRPTSPLPNPPNPEAPNSVPYVPYAAAQSAYPADAENKSKPRGRSSKDWQDFTEKRFGPLVFLILWFILRDQERAKFYAPTPSECEELAPHISRIAPRVEKWLNIPAWGHDLLVTSDDSLSLILLVAGYLERIGVLDRLSPWNRGNHEHSGMAQSVRPQEPVDNGSANGSTAANNGHLELVIAGLGRQYE